MANVDTNEEFWGITLSKESKIHSWNPAEDEDDVEHKIQVTQACLGVKAKEGERNVIEVTTEDDEGKKMSCAVVSLRVGSTECMHLELGFTNPVKFVLKEGSGPISLCGVHLSAAPLDFDDGDEDTSEEEEEEDLSVFIDREDEECPTLQDVISGGCAKIEEISDDKVELPVQKTKKAADATEIVENKEVAEEKEEVVEEKEAVEKDSKKRSLPAEEEEKEIVAPKKKKEEVEEKEEEEDDDEDDEDDDGEDVDEDDEEDDEDMDDDEDDIDMDDIDSDDMDSDDEDNSEDEEEEEEEEPPKSAKKQPAKVNGVPPKKGGKVNGSVTPARKEGPKAKTSANKENVNTENKAATTPKAKNNKDTPKKDTTTPKKTKEELKTFLLKSPNLPKKFEKFTNFLSNNMKVTETKVQKDLWEFVQKNKK